MAVDKREDISEEYKWSVEKVYQNTESWEKDLQRARDLVKELEKGPETFESASQLLSVLENYEEIMRLCEKLYKYASMKHHEDMRESRFQELQSKARALLSSASQASSFIRPGIQSIPEEELEQMLSEKPELERYSHYIDNIMRSKPHTRSPEVESVLADLGEVLGSSETYSRLSNADLKFPVVEKPDGEEVELTHSNFTRFLKNRDREFREEVYSKFYDRIEEFSNTFATTFENSIKTDVKLARLRNFDTAREKALHGPKIPVSVYDNLVETVRENLDLLHRHTDMKKEVLGVEEMRMWDIYMPLAETEEPEISFEEAKKHVLEAVKPLGEEYQEKMRKGLENGWVDVYENRGKRSGAYSGGSYDTMPYILMNYQNDINSMYTLAHELGHSMHSQYTKENQPYVYSDYSIFVAEVASTMNEALLTRHLLDTVEDENFRRHVLSHYLENFRGTLYRQTMFADFEHKVHTQIEEGGALTADSLNSLYREHKEDFYATSVVDDRMEKEWMRIPHFYYNYYVYQYATGISAAIALSARVLEKGESAAEDYIEFLSSGSSNYPVEVLKKAGVDMSSKKPIEQALKEYEKHLDKFDSMIQRGE